MSRYIDADKAIQQIKEEIETVRTVLPASYFVGIVEKGETIIKFLKAQPTVDVVERKHGKWIPIKDDEHWYVLRWECSCCGFWTTSDKMANYCEDCGAEMRGGND